MSSTTIKGMIHYHLYSNIISSNGMGLLGGTGSGKYTLYTLLHGLLKPLKRGLNFGDSFAQPSNLKPRTPRVIETTRLGKYLNIFATNQGLFVYSIGYWGDRIRNNQPGVIQYALMPKPKRRSGYPNRPLPRLNT
ncbi:hypothetical protein B0H13DRAFT_1887502 [Mycena leptocephala]|nr:hypothetical protein B0H13DRAFT_1887502 [Mycena leptocephala]